MAPLPLEATLHVGDAEEDGVHLALLDQVAQLLEGKCAPWLAHPACSRVASMASSSASSPWARGPLNHLRALSSQYPPA